MPSRSTVFAHVSILLTRTYTANINKTGMSASDGGIISAAGILEVGDCIFADSCGKRGGALQLQETSQLLAINCTFARNIASLEGGAIATAGAVTLLSSVFDSNSAVSGAGGAMCVDGDVAVAATRCTFTGNTAAKAGGAVFTESADAAALKPDLTGSTFEGNTASCCYAAGYGHALAAAAASSLCSDVDNGVGSSCCGAGEYTTGTACVRCAKDSMACSVTGTDTATLPLAAGYWRADLDSLDVKQCYRQEACKGGVAVNSSDDYCAEGYRGPCECQSSLCLLVYSV
jgi:predicted outer membrane repeat protein